MIVAADRAGVADEGRGVTPGLCAGRGVGTITRPISASIPIHQVVCVDVVSTTSTRAAATRAIYRDASAGIGSPSVHDDVVGDRCEVIDGARAWVSPQLDATPRAI